MYTCEAVNEVATATSSVTVTVHVHPNTTVTMETVISLLGQTAELECVAIGNPPPIVSWSRGPQVLPGLDGRVSLLSGLLRITMATLDDEGIYTCTAVNSVGRASSDVQLIVYGENRVEGGGRKGGGWRGGGWRGGGGGSPEGGRVEGGGVEGCQS